MGNKLFKMPRQNEQQWIYFVLFEKNVFSTWGYKRLESRNTTEKSLKIIEILVLSIHTKKGIKMQKIMYS